MKIRNLAIYLLSALPLGLSSATYHHEFGTIAEDGGVVSHTFTLPAGTSPLSVINAFPGCPCISVDYPKRPLKAREPMKITLKYNPERQKATSPSRYICD